MMAAARWFVCLALLTVVSSASDDLETDATEVKYWALKFGKAIFEGSAEATHLRVIKENYMKHGAELKWVSATDMFDEMRVDVQHMMRWKKEAVLRLYEAAEAAAASHVYDKTLKYDNYYNIKKLDDENKLDLVPMKNFDGNPVNINESVIHVPTNVYDKAPQVVNAIKWSEHLNPMFKNNMAIDSSLYYQFFGSSAGFLRLFPATRWRLEPPSPDMYDSRMRRWYIQAAASPKDLVILLDGSGSMTGLRKQIARYVVENILDTLTDNDYVTVLRFSEKITPVDECFENSMALASDANIRGFKERLANLETANIANFSLALIKAFEMLQMYNRTGLGTQCNQAIMLITDGAPSSFDEIFKRFNWPNNPVRVFTYLIGREVTAIKEVNDMACSNRGYYTHVTTLAEVREQVLKYIPVISRPLVLYDFHQHVWTPVYADVSQVQLMTTIAAPVFDKRNYSTKMGKLLGVVGLDLPIREIIKLTYPYKLGVGGYSFIINNNGYILYHPEHRPLFQDTIKSDFSSVDLYEVEQEDMDLPPRAWGPHVRLIRDNMINKKFGWNAMDVKIQMDNMRRILTRKNQYYYGGIDETPFRLAIALPDPYGHYSVEGQVEVKNKEEDFSKYFEGTNWRVHPDWVYCAMPPKMEQDFNTSEDIIRYFLKEVMDKQNFKWHSRSKLPTIFDKPDCQKELIQKLVFDAKVTLVSPKPVLDNNIKYEDTWFKLYGIVTTFVATRSGLLRFQDLWATNETRNTTDKPFYEEHVRSIDELFYKRAVDYHYHNSSAFVFSVPFDAGTRKDDPLVTGSHAIFLGAGLKKAPAAVVGLQFKHSAFAKRFFNITSTCQQSCQFNCNSSEMECYLLDNNGFVVVSEEHEHTGKFFGEIDSTLFLSMIKYDIYKKVTYYDYQAICKTYTTVSGPASMLTTPFTHLKNAILWLWGKMLLYFVHYNLMETFDWAMGYQEDDVVFEQMHKFLNKTKVRPCDKEIDLYEMKPLTSGEPIKGRLASCAANCDKNFIVQPIPFTNLIMLASYTKCPCEATSQPLASREVLQMENETLVCDRRRNHPLRALPCNCTSYHSDETEIKQCGRGTPLSINVPLMLLLVTLFML